MEMDWQPNRFFDDTGRWLLCATHGAVYQPDTGECARRAVPRRPDENRAHASSDGVVHWHTAYNLQPVALLTDHERIPPEPPTEASSAARRAWLGARTLEKLMFATLAGAAHRAPLAHLHPPGLAGLLRVPGLGTDVAQGPATADKTLPHTAVIEIKGEIASDGDASAEAVVAAMRSAFEDAGAQGVVLLINSPGGSPVQAGIINDEIKRLKAKHKKPVYAVVEESCASAAYYIAAAGRPASSSTRPASSAASAC